MTQHRSAAARRVYVCLNTDCHQRGNDALYNELCKRGHELTATEIHEYICFGNCEEGANVVVYPDRVWLSGLRIDKHSVVLDYLLDGKLSEAHAGKVDAELAETIYELLELGLEDEQAEDEQAPLQRSAT